MSLIHDLFSWLMTMFVIAPLQAELEEQIQIASVPPTILQDVRACIETGTVALVDRATNDLWWGVNTTVQIVIGYQETTDVLAAATPECEKAMAAFRPFLESPEV